MSVREESVRERYRRHDGAKIRQPEYLILEDNFLYQDKSVANYSLRIAENFLEPFWLCEKRL